MLQYNPSTLHPGIVALTPCARYDQSLRREESKMGLQNSCGGRVSSVLNIVTGSLLPVRTILMKLECVGVAA